MQLGYQDIGTYNNSVPTHGLVPKGSVAPENAGSRMCGVTVCCESGTNLRLILRHFYIYTIQTLSSQVFLCLRCDWYMTSFLKSLQWLLTSDTIVPYSNSFLYTLLMPSIRQSTAVLHIAIQPRRLIVIWSKVSCLSEDIWGFDVQKWHTIG